mgnify:CR=1 FL=1
MIGVAKTLIALASKKRGGGGACANLLGAQTTEPIPRSATSKPIVTTIPVIVAAPPRLRMTNRSITMPTTGAPGVGKGRRTSIADSAVAAWQTLLPRAHARGGRQREVEAGLMFEVGQGQFCARTGVEAEAVDHGYVEHVVDNVMMPVILHAGSAASTGGAIRR